MVDRNDIKRYLANLDDERSSSALYRIMAESEKNPHIASVYRHLAETEEKHIDLFAKKLVEAGASDLEQHAVRHGVHRGGGWARVEEAQLAEEAARLETAEKNLAPAGHAPRMQEPLLHDEQGRVALPLRENLLAWRER